MSEAIRSSFFHNPSGNGFRQQSEPALLTSENNVTPTLMRFESQPTLSHSSECSGVQIDGCVPIETQSILPPSKSGKPKKST